MCEGYAHQDGDDGRAQYFLALLFYIFEQLSYPQVSPIHKCLAAYCAGKLIDALMSADERLPSPSTLESDDGSASMLYRAEALRELWRRHGTIRCALTGDSIDVLKQCVPLRATEGKGDQSEETTSVIDIVNGEPRSYIIEGEPARGKTGVAFRLVTEAVRRGMLAAYIPVVRLAEVADKVGADGSPLDAFLSLLHPEISAAIDKNECLLIFDGLDEAGAHKETFLAIIGHLAETPHRVVITTRPGSCDVPLIASGTLRELKLQYLSDSEQEYLAQQKLGADKCAEFTQLACLYPELRGIPLMLRMMLCVFEQGIDNYGRQKNDLYEKSLDVLLRRYELNVQSSRSQISELGEQKKQNLRELAYKMHAESGQGRDFTCEDAAQWSSQSETWDSIMQGVACGRFACITSFVDADVRIYRFAHLSFQEYYCAERLAALSDWSSCFRLKDIIRDPWWANVFKMLPLDRLAGFAAGLEEAKQGEEGPPALDLQDWDIAAEAAAVLGRVLTQYFPKIEELNLTGNQRLFSTDGLEWLAAGLSEQQEGFLPMALITSALSDTVLVYQEDCDKWLLKRPAAIEGTEGVDYCRSKDLNDKLPGKIAPWGSLVKGTDTGDGWLKVLVGEPGHPSLQRLALGDCDIAPEAGPALNQLFPRLPTVKEIKTYRIKANKQLNWLAFVPYQIVLATVSENGTTLRYASNEMKDTDSIAGAAVKYGFQLREAPDDLKDNQTTVLAAVRANGRTLTFASDRLKNTEIVARTAMEQNGFSLQYASENMTNTESVAMAAVQENGLALCHAHERLRNARAIVLAAVSQNFGALVYASPSLRDDEEIVLAAVNCERRHFPKRRADTTLGYASKRVACVDAVRKAAACQLARCLILGNCDVHVEAKADQGKKPVEAK